MREILVVSVIIVATITFTPQGICAWNSRLISSKTTPRQVGHHFSRVTHKKQPTTTTTWLLQGKRSDDDFFEPKDILIQETSLGLRRVSWLSWWVQVILSTVSTIILVFARNVLKGQPVVSNGGGGSMNFVLAGTGIVASFVSIFWTWGGGARLSRRLDRRPASRIQAANMVRRAVSVGVSLNIIGMLLTLIGAEQTVGYLAIKVLTAARPWNPTGSLPIFAANEGLQPLDILVVQANTNALLSHFGSLVCYLYLNRFINKLDPPSVEGKLERNN